MADERKRPVSPEDTMVSLHLMKSIFGDAGQPAGLLPFSGEGIGKREACWPDVLLLVCWFADPKRQRRITEVCQIHGLVDFDDPNNSITLECTTLRKTDLSSVFGAIGSMNRCNQLLRLMICPVPTERCLGLLLNNNDKFGHNTKTLVMGRASLNEETRAVEGYKDVSQFLKAQDRANGLSDEDLMMYTDTRLFISRRMQYSLSRELVAGTYVAFQRALMPLTIHNLEMLSNCPTFHAGRALFDLDPPKHLSPKRKRVVDDDDVARSMIAG